MWQINRETNGNLNLKKFSHLKRVEAILDITTIDRGVSQLHKTNEFHALKEFYSKLKEVLKKSDNSLTDEEAGSIINYAIHKDIED